MTVVSRVLSIKAMTEEKYEAFKAFSQNAFAQDLAKSQDVLFADALKNASEQFDRLVPNGLKTPGQYFFSVSDATSTQSIGFLWFGITERLGRRVASINDIFIGEEYRGRGHSKEVMLFAEERAKDADATQIRLHVFQKNEIAKKLYARMGYAVSSVDMFKDI